MNKELKENNINKVAVIGLGYVGLPLAVEFGKQIKTIGFDINVKRVDQLLNGIDITSETNKDDLIKSKYLKLTSKIIDLESCNIFIVTVPTPIDKNNKPELLPLKNSTEMIAEILKKDDIVIYESTVFPGATEEFCVPILEKISGLKFNKDFFCGYSPERINPGDTKHRLPDIKKITSGSTPKTAILIDRLYNKIIKAGTHMVGSIKIAEAAKVIENIQRDVNIALINEFAVIFKKLNIDTESVLEAASTKWNFLPFKPGLVGGHCISVDPYYLAHKSKEVGYNPKVLLAGRKLNDNMSSYIVEQVAELMSNKNIPLKNSKILIMGVTFKENCPDFRNSKVIDIIKKFKYLECNIDVFDPLVDQNKLTLPNGVSFLDKSPTQNTYDVIILAVAHNHFKKMSKNKIASFGKTKNVIYDIKYLLKPDQVDGRL